MKKSNIFILLLFALFGCRQPATQVSIEGEIAGLQHDTLYLYGMDDLYDRIDTLVARSGKFSHTTSVDTLTSVYLLIDNRIEQPLYLDKGNKIHIKGEASDLDYLHVSGNVYNDELTAFRAGLRTTPAPTASEVVQRAEEFILQHRFSFVSLYLLDKYFVQQPSPDFEKIKKLVENMAGVLQDKPYIEQLNERIARAEKSVEGKYAPFFSLPNAKGERISRNAESFKKKHLLLHFWASWDESPMQQEQLARLRGLYKRYKKSKHIALLGISLDLDRQTWQAAVKRDTLLWEQVCDGNGFSAEVPRQYGVTRLPQTIILSPEGRILARGLDGEALEQKLKELSDAAEEKEKQARSANTKRK